MNWRKFISRLLVFKKKFSIIEDPFSDIVEESDVVRFFIFFAVDSGFFVIDDGDQKGGEQIL